MSPPKDPGKEASVLAPGSKDSDQLLVYLLKVYGLKPILGGIALALVRWFLAYSAAKLGTEVNILWGLTSYTKWGDVSPTSPGFSRTAHEI